MSEQKPPLWEAMYDAWCKTTDPLISDQAAVEHGTAAEIRALRDWLVPEEDKPNDEFCCPPVYTMLWQQRRDLRALLTAEADRAECGDQSTKQEH